MTTKKHKPLPSSGHRKKRLYVAVILAVTAIAYLPSLRNSFVNWDDPKYLTENHITWALNADNVKEIFFPSDLKGKSYVPLSQLSFAIENHFIRPDYSRLDEWYNYAKVHHYTNLFFHLVNTALVFYLVWLLAGCRIAPAVVVSLFFGIHPMHVESVAWITERKDVLFTCFFLLSAICFVKHRMRESEENGVRSAGSGGRKLYLWSLVLFLMALLAKSAAVPLPLTLGLIVYWMTGKIGRKDVLQLVPFFVLALAHGIITVAAMKSVNSIASAEAFSLLQRIMFASHGTVIYIAKLFVPYGLTNYYPYPNLIGDRLPYIFYISPFLVIALLVFIAWSFRRSRLFVFGFGFFFANVFLVLQLMPVGPNILCERYTYVPYIGLLFMAGFGYSLLQERGRAYGGLVTMLRLAMAGYTIWFGWLTWERCKVWENSEKLWTNVIEQYQYQVPVAYKNRGNYYGKRKEFSKALDDYNIFLQLQQDDAGIFVNRGNIFGLQGQHSRALADFTKAIEIDPANGDAYINSAITYSFMSRFEEALQNYNKALQVEPAKWLEIYQNRGYTYIQLGRYSESAADYSQVIRATPNDPKAWLYRGIANYGMGDYRAALGDVNAALARNPNFADAYYNRSLVHKALGNTAAARSDAQTAQRLGRKVDAGYLQSLGAN